MQGGEGEKEEVGGGGGTKMIIRSGRGFFRVLSSYLLATRRI